MAATPPPTQGRPRRRQQSDASPRRAAAGEAGFPVVAIGASAGGLEAFRILLAALPADSGMAFILVQHLDPRHPSRMVDLLSPHTAMAVLEAGEGMRLAPDHVYVIPPGHHIAVRNGAIHLSRPPIAQLVRMPYDLLLQSLADSLGERAVCIILSGTGTDGSAGAKAIKERGGLVIAQEPNEAEHDGMPRSAIQTGCVDFVLELAQMPQALARYAGHGYIAGGQRGGALLSEEAVARILELLRRKTAHDFALYKHGTVGRRIERRMALSGMPDGKAYLDRLSKDPEEVQRLASDLLINVTRFFRDTSVFAAMAEKIVPELVRDQPPDRPIRVWVPGCSSGEEAYSIAMLLLEAITVAEVNLKLQIFASDVDQEAVAFGREGLYPSAIEADMSPERLARFFRKEDRGYRVSETLRACVIFSVHDLVADAPFSRLDLVSCRNLLIYLRPEVQQKVIALFHFALREGGFLVLGTSESVAGGDDRFLPIDKLRIYRHIGHSRAGEVEFPLGRGEAARSLWLRPPRPAGAPRARESDLAQRVLLEAYAPASVLVNRKHEGLYYFGATDRYLTIPTGVASLDLLASARDGLRPAIRAALEKAGEEDGGLVSVAGRVKRDGVPVAVTVSARRVKSDGETLILLSFLDKPEPEKAAPAIELPADGSRIAQLEQELDAARNDLKQAIHDCEIADEELKAVNEEAMSASEEYQTTNEELETSKEELQSLNEELTALNTQLQETLERYQAAANDLENILNSTEVATLFLDPALNIRFFTPAARALFSVIATDIGRPLGDLAHHFADGKLLADAAIVLASLVPVVRDVRAENGSWYTCRTLPYRTKDNRIEGVVISFVDITLRKRAEDVLNEAKLLAEGANLAKSRFLGAASHDLRQPLQTLSLLQGLLARKIKEPDTARLVALADEALRAMSGMLNTLLDINQLEAGVIHPEIVAFPIDELLERLKTEFSYHTEAHGLEWHVLPSRLAVVSDPRLLEQMIRNLVANALKYTTKGGILLGCRRRGDKLRIEIWDTGLGIPDSQLRMIFEEFHQIDNDTHELSRGLGLGLAIVQRLGDLLGHVVEVRSRVGRGSVFSIEVPIAAAAMPAAPKLAARESGEGAARTGTILIVEDDPQLRSTLDLLLRSEGHRTATATDGEEAIDLVARKEADPQIAIVDYNLPGPMTGLEAIAGLRARIDHDLPALVLTGDISTATLRQISEQGHVPLHKPVPAEELSRSVQQLLARAGGPAAAPAAGPSGDRADGQVTIYVVDDDQFICRLMADFLGGQGWKVETFANCEAFLKAYQPDGAACLLLDEHMPGLSGLELLRRLRAQGDRLPVIMATGHGDVRLAVQAMQAGAQDFIEKPFDRAELLTIIARVLEQPGDRAARQRSHALAAARFAELSPREREVMDRVLAGQPSKNIAADLGVSQRTVENHRAAVMKKSGARSLPELIRLALAALEPAPEGEPAIAVDERNGNGRKA